MILYEIKKEYTQQNILTIKEVMKITTLSRSTIYRMIKLGLFPKPINISTHRIGFVSEDINFWIKNISNFID